MDGISTRISLLDNMTGPAMQMVNSLDTLVNGFNLVQASSLNIGDSAAASFGAVHQQIDLSTVAAERMNSTFNMIDDAIRRNEQEQERFNNQLKQGGNLADSLTKKIGGMVAAYASIQGVKTVLGLSDELSNTTARLNLINDGMQTTQELYEKIYLSAERSKADLSDTANMVATLGSQAKNAFSSNDELIAFTEQLNKTFVIAGTSATGIESTMYNLTQALASGTLRGQDLNAVLSNAQPIVENIANYLGISVAEVREMSSKGLLTASIIKNSMFAAAEETNRKFAEIPDTFAQVFTSIKRQALMQFRPILERLNQIANSGSFKILTQNVVGALIIVSNVVMDIFDMVGGVAQFAADNWSWLAPVIIAVAWTMAGYVTILKTYNTIQAISNGLKAIAAVQEYVAAKAVLANAAAHSTAAVATAQATIAQAAFNTALLACPLTWIIIAIIAIIGVIYLVIGIINKCAGTSVSATGIIFGAFSWLGSVVANIFFALLEVIFSVINKLVNPFIDFANLIENIFKNPVAGVIYLFQSMADYILADLESIASAIDFLFGSSLADTVASWRSGIKEMADSAVEGMGLNPDDFNTINKLDLSVEKTLGFKRFDNTDAFNAGYESGETIENMIVNFDPNNMLGSNIPDKDAYEENYLANIDANTRDQLDYSEEELKLWRDIAERDTINRFTTAEITVTQTNTNNINSDMDLDGIVNHIADGTREALIGVAEGVHQ